MVIEFYIKKVYAVFFWLAWGGFKFSFIVIILVSSRFGVLKSMLCFVANL